MPNLLDLAPKSKIKKEAKPKTDWKGKYETLRDQYTMLNTEFRKQQETIMSFANHSDLLSKTKNEIMGEIIKYLKDKEYLNKHETYILKCFLIESNNTNYITYKLQALIEILKELTAK